MLSSCKAFPSRQSELDDYFTIILNLGAQFGGSTFNTYHLFFTVATGWVQQFNEGTY